MRGNRNTLPIYYCLYEAWPLTTCSLLFLPSTPLRLFCTQDMAKAEGAIIIAAICARFDISMAPCQVGDMFVRFLRRTSVLFVFERAPEDIISWLVDCVSYIPPTKPTQRRCRFLKPTPDNHRASNLGGSCSSPSRFDLRCKTCSSSSSLHVNRLVPSHNGGTTLEIRLTKQRCCTLYQ